MNGFLELQFLSPGNPTQWGLPSHRLAALIFWAQMCASSISNTDFRSKIWKVRPNFQEPKDGLIKKRYILSNRMKRKRL